jgi:hypothetical protein
MVPRRNVAIECQSVPTRVAHDGESLRWRSARSVLFSDRLGVALAARHDVDLVALDLAAEGDLGLPKDHPLPRRGRHPLGIAGVEPVLIRYRREGGQRCPGGRAKAPDRPSRTTGCLVALRLVREGRSFDGTPVSSTLVIRECPEWSHPA